MGQFSRTLLVFKMALESKAFFRERTELFGLSTDQLNLLTAKYNTFGSFAFSSSHTPGAGNDEALIINVVQRLFGDAPSDELAAAMAQMDFDGSGEVDFDEFLAWWKIQVGSASGRSPPPGSSAGRGDRASSPESPRAERPVNLQDNQRCNPADGTIAAGFGYLRTLRTSRMYIRAK